MKSFDEMLPQDQGRSFGGNEDSVNEYEEDIDLISEQEYLIRFGDLPCNRI